MTHSFAMLLLIFTGALLDDQQTPTAAPAAAAEYCATVSHIDVADQPAYPGGRYCVPAP